MRVCEKCKKAKATVWHYSAPNRKAWLCQRCDHARYDGYMRATTPQGKGFLPRLAGLSHCDTEGVIVSVSKRNRYPQANGEGRVWLPLCLFDPGNEDILESSWRHELQHARDGLDGILGSLTYDEAEARAVRAERQEV